VVSRELRRWDGQRRPGPGCRTRRGNRDRRTEVRTLPAHTTGGGGLAGTPAAGGNAGTGGIAPTTTAGNGGAGGKGYSPDPTTEPGTDGGNGGKGGTGGQHGDGTTFGAVVQSYFDQGVLPRNVIALVERPKDTDHGDNNAPTEDATTTEPTAKSWPLAEAERFRAAVSDHRLFGCWLLSMYGMRRSEVLGLRWSAVDLDTGTLSVRRGRVAVGGQAVEGAPKSRRSRRDLPLPADVVAALRVLRQRQRAEALALGIGWSDNRLVAVHEDGTPLRPEFYTDEFQRLRTGAGLRRIRLHGLRNTSVSLMLDRGHPPHIVAAWHGHDPAVALSIYADVKADELRAVGASLFG
jgi:integrase